jgi:hypothetical protein
VCMCVCLFVYQIKSLERGSLVRNAPVYRNVSDLVCKPQYVVCKSLFRLFFHSNFGCKPAKQFYVFCIWEIFVLIFNRSNEFSFSYNKTTRCTNF